VVAEGGDSTTWAILVAAGSGERLGAERPKAFVALGERDCSLQRRHQKLVEEAPAPGLDEAERRHLHELAIRLGREAGLRGAATCEFLRDPAGAAWFLEVNTRLQVEHGVTELVTGLDLVREQFFVAAGEPLSPAVLAAAERAATPDRHAIELRVSRRLRRRHGRPLLGPGRGAGDGTGDFHNVIVA